MKRLGPALSFATSTILASIWLTGCGGFAGVAIPDTVTSSVTPSGPEGTLSGSVYGGHAPIVGAHVYVLEPGTSGYGSQATSDMYTAATGNGSAITKNATDTGIPSSWYYVTSDASGGFQLTGDYQCNPGHPVYLYAYGGTPSYPASSLGTTNTFNVGGANGTAGTATETYVSGGSVTSVAITNGGSGYMDGTYNLTFTGGGGTGAAGTATVTGLGGNVTAINITNGGTGYTSAPTITVNDLNSLGTAATLTPTISNTVDDIQFTVSSSNTNGVSSPPENFYVGETVSFSGLSGTVGGLVGTSGTVLSTGLTTTTFDVQVTGGIGSGTASLNVPANSIVIGTPANNPAIVNLAVLGVCPASGNFSSTSTVTLASGTTIPVSPLSYVYMNEISTVVTAFAFEGFTAPSATQNNATYIGSSATNLIGMQNAALNAGQLYDIQGSSVTSSYAGEGHIARSTTPTIVIGGKTYGGGGTIPQALIDTLGNILAACVDSNNTNVTATGTGTGVSPQCSVLLQTATQNGIPYSSSPAAAGTVPLDIAQAAINIANNPAGNAAYTATFMSNLYALPTGNVPFTPNLTSTGFGQPNDFTIGILFNNANNGGAVPGPEGIAIDAGGNAWIDSLTNGTLSQMNPQGIVTYTSSATSGLGLPNIDPSGNVWDGDRLTGSQVLTRFTPTVSSYAVTTATQKTFQPFTNGFSEAYVSIANSSGNIYFGAAVPATTANTDDTTFLSLALNATGGALTNFPITADLPEGVTIDHGAVENLNTGGDIWWTTENYGGYIVRFNPTTGALASGFPVTKDISTCEEAGIDASSNLWCANQSGTYANDLLKITTTGAVTVATGGTLTAPFGVAVDGAGNVFVTNHNAGNGTSVAEYSGSTATNISPNTTNYEPISTLATKLGGLYDAIDQSGTLWITSYENSLVVQWIGAGKPAYNPLSVASGVSKLGAKP